jgi:hypothetical protein
MDGASRALCRCGRLLGGCVTPVQAKNVEQNITGYLTQNFAPGDLPASVEKTISDADADTDQLSP